MIVPNVAHPSNTPKHMTDSGSYPKTHLDYWPEPSPRYVNVQDGHADKRTRGLGKGTAYPRATSSSGRTVPYRKNSGTDLVGRHMCRGGAAYYVCANGFKGCCSTDPCGPGALCLEFLLTTTITHHKHPKHHTATALQPGSQSSAPTESSVAEVSSTSLPSQESVMSKTSSTQGNSQTLAPSTREQPSGSMITTPTQSLASSISALSSPSASSTGSSVPPPPSCPKGNGTLYADSHHVKYIIRCNYDNTFPVDTITEIGRGGYGACFSACSASASCTGFTYIGDKRGKCYFKTAMPLNEFEPAGNDYVSCAKTNSTALLPPAVSSPATTKSRNTRSSVGPVVGGILGGVVFVGLLLFLIAYLAGRHRRKLEERKSASIIIGRPQPIDLDNTYPCSGHGRAGSIGNGDIASHARGSYEPPTPTRIHTRQRSIYHEDRNFV